MEKYDFTYSIPPDFESRIAQLLRQEYHNHTIANSFSNCHYEYDDVGLAYYAGLRSGDNWNKKALDFTIEGSTNDISVLRNNDKIVRDVLSKALKTTETGFLLRKMLYLVSEKQVTFPKTNEERLKTDISSAEAVLADLIKVGEKLCSNQTYDANSSENNINDFFRDALSLMGYNEIKDQTRHAVSDSGKEAGEVDILITKEGKEVAIFEGLKLTSVNTSNIDNHIEKAILNYNSLGTTTFVVAYVDTSDFESFWNRFYEHLKKINFPLNVKRAVHPLTYPNASTRIAEMVLSRDDFDFPVYFITFRLLRGRS